MKHAGTIAARFGWEALAGCACKIAAIVDEKGRIVQLSKLQDIAYGEMNGVISPRIERLDKVMQGAGFDARLSPDIEREMWEKWVLLATLGGVTCLMRGNVGEIEAVPEGTAFSLQFLDEVTKVVTAAGHAPGEVFLEGIKTLLTQKGSPQTSSMYRDLQNGNPVEAEQILGDLLARARHSGVAAPLLAAAFANLSIYQRRLAAP
jgi:2-dehydropantoate 2-reductase